MVNYINENLPSAFIGINKNRLKVYSDGYKTPSVFLKDKSEFQIEIFNPTQGSVLAKIKLNGEYISNKGLVLRPGERVWLDRYIDENKKFQFSTYEVEAGNYQVDNAIRNNGELQIEFYDEKATYSNKSDWLTTNTSNISYYNSASSPTFGDTTFTSSVDNLSFMDQELGTRGIVGDAGPAGPPGYTPISKSTKSTKETGRVEKGNISNQSFNEVDMEFNSWTTNIISYKLMPESYQNLNSEDVRVKYCTHCGKKITKTAWKFCPDCGTKV